MSVKPDSGLALRVHPSPNHNERREGKPIDMIVLHYTGMADEDAALRRLCDPRAEVSAHYFVRETGDILQCVPEARRAWHAGRSFWKGETDINSRSIGIEIANPGHEWGYRDFPAVQVEAVIALCRDICARHAIPPWRVLAHSDVAPQRKEDPGEKFPWERLARAGIGHHVAPAPLAGGRFFQEGEAGQPVEALQSMLALYGYDVPISGVFDARTRAAVAAFQRHFRPERVDGIADVSTIVTLHTLLAALPELG
ncbi:N-acetylmuramoyl-L-alanine amidase [Polymorphum gilvum]|uniref:N-acetylmuramoyl-L-alanine amidase n=1 Tax=Polymorphum gilvum (strain LMG 25793 / CGMCC 1.9160 / SL003B-26A1) TaxID=991905 RepID=F2J1H9_POLGS|nr:N-acetylmuramoyl-L-alanine amidase [Polymorphum gilvum]ADZ69761.1 N-acetylmuramoyl-L-alanine amidase domain protein [Polymorphum gilvum SL003B-26A1]